MVSFFRADAHVEKDRIEVAHTKDAELLRAFDTALFCLDRLCLLIGQQNRVPGDRFLLAVKDQLAEHITLSVPLHMEGEFEPAGCGKGLPFQFNKPLSELLILLRGNGMKLHAALPPCDEKLNHIYFITACQ